MPRTAVAAKARRAGAAAARGSERRMATIVVVVVAKIEERASRLRSETGWELGTRIGTILNDAEKTSGNVVGYFGDVFPICR